MLISNESADNLRQLIYNSETIGFPRKKAADCCVRSENKWQYPPRCRSHGSL